MAIEWGKSGIRINTICPTFIRTPLSAETLDNPERLAWIMDKIKLPRVGEVEDIMGAAVFLASDASAMVTGTSLLIAGYPVEVVQIQDNAVKTARIRPDDRRPIGEED